MGRRLNVKMPAVVRLTQHLLRSMYRDADKQMWIGETFKGTPVILPCSMSITEIHQHIIGINNAAGIVNKAEYRSKRAPSQLGLFA